MDPDDREDREDRLQDGVKFDDGKGRWDLLCPVAMDELVKVSTFGAVKYAPRNWEKGMRYGRVFAALMRHSWAWWRGEESDQESGLHHMAHAMWCCMVLLRFSIGSPFRANSDNHLDDSTFSRFDDRPINR